MRLSPSQQDDLVVTAETIDHQAQQMDAAYLSAFNQHQLPLQEAADDPTCLAICQTLSDPNKNYDLAHLQATLNPLPQSAVTETLLGLIAADQGNEQAAYQHFMTAVSLDQRPIFRLHAAMAALVNREFCLGMNYLNDILAEQPEHLFCHGLLAIIYCLLNDWPQAAAHAKSVDQHGFQTWENNVPYELAAFGINFHQQLSLQCSLQGETLFQQPLSAVEPIAQQAPKLFLKQVSTTPDVVFFFAADPLYLLDYGETLFYSILDTMAQRNFLVHIHLYEPTQPAMQFLKALQAKHPDQLQYTFLPPQNMTISHFAAMRFVLLRQLLAHYQTTILMLDADALLMHDVTPLLADYPRAMGLCTTQGRPYMDAYMAGAGLYRHTPETQLLLTYHTAFILTVLRSPKTTKYLDQIGLYFGVKTLMETRKMIPEHAFDFIDPALFCSTAFAPEAYIWAVVGYDKQENNPFHQRAQQIRVKYHLKEKHDS